MKYKTPKWLNVTEKIVTVLTVIVTFPFKIVFGIADLIYAIKE